MRRMNPFQLSWLTTDSGSSAYLRTGLLWLAVCVAVSTVIIRLNLRTAEARFHSEAEYIAESIYEKLRINDAVLEGFASMYLVIGENNHEQARTYARTMRERYPHIYMIETQARTEPQDIEQLERVMRREGHSTFQIRNFQYDTDRTWRAIESRPFYYPIVFMEPYTSAAASVLGLDVYSVPHLRTAIDRAIASNHPVASEPFDLVEGGQAYVLFLPVRVTRNGAPPAPQAPNTIVSIVVHIENLFSATLSHAMHPSIALAYLPGANTEKEIRKVLAQGTKTSALAAALLPRVTYRREPLLKSQPFVIEIEQQLTWDAVNFRILGALLLLTALGYALSAFHIRALLRERAHLERRVAERTAELSETNRRLLAEMDERVSAEHQLQQHARQNRQLARRLITLQEDEHRYLARELHDELGQILTAIKTEAALLQRGPLEADAVRGKSESIITMADHIYGVAHALMRRLRPAALDETGLRGALEECGATLRLDQLGIRQHIAIHGDLDTLNERLRITVYRIVQEALTNIARHSHAANAWIELTRQKQPDGKGADMLQIVVRDDGIGIGGNSPGEGYGLIGLRERVLAVGGNLDVASHPGHGVTITATIPVQDD